MRYTISVCAIVFLGIFSGCGAVDKTPPSVSSTTPSNGASGVAVDQAVTIAFSENVAASSIDVQLLQGTPSVPVPASVTKSSSYARLTPERPLNFNTSYRVVVKKSLLDASGNAMAADYELSFATGSKNSTFSEGAVLQDSFIRRVWGGSAFNPQAQLYSAGMRWARIGVTTRTFPTLETTPPSNWGSIPYQNGFWGCREVAGEMLKEAHDAGCKLDAFLFLSDSPANAGQQSAPSGWDSSTPSALLPDIKASAHDTAAYFGSLGLTIDMYEIGNEVDFGMLGYFLGDKIAKPTSSDWINQPGWLENNVWTYEVDFIKAAIQGIKSVSPSSKIGLHIAGFGYSVDDAVVGRFFTYMANKGVQFDVAELSYPYMFGGSPVPQPYFRQTSFANALDSLKALGKEAYIAEFSYPAASDGITATPSYLYPFTDSGQSDFVGDFLKVVQSHADAAFYFYPDYYPGCTTTTPELQSSGLFSTAVAPRLSLSQF